MNDLLAEAKSLPVSDGGNRTEWKKKYAKVFFVLVDEKGLTGKAAVDWIVEKERLTERQAISLYRCAMYWKERRDAQ